MYNIQRLVVIAILVTYALYNILVFLDKFIFYSHDHSRAYAP